MQKAGETACAEQPRACACLGVSVPRLRRPELEVWHVDVNQPVHERKRGGAVVGGRVVHDGQAQAPRDGGGDRLSDLVEWVGGEGGAGWVAAFACGAHACNAADAGTAACSGRERSAVQCTCGATCSGVTRLILCTRPSSCRRSIQSASCSALRSKPARRWLMSQFWQKTQRRLHMEKKTVPLPAQPCSRGARACGARHCKSSCRDVHVQVPRAVSCVLRERTRSGASSAK